MNNTTPYVKFTTLKAMNRSGMPWQRRYVLCQLWELADARTGVIPSPYSYSGLASVMGMSKRAVQDHVKELVAGSWVACTPPDSADAIRRHEKNRYRCIPRTVAEFATESNHGGNHAVASAAMPPESPKDKTAGRAMASAALEQQMPTSQVKTISKATPPGVALREQPQKMPSPAPQMPASQEQRNPLVCTTCHRDIWVCLDDYKGRCPQVWVCLCGGKIDTDWLQEGDKITATLLRCYGCKTELDRRPNTVR